MSDETFWDARWNAEERAEAVANAEGIMRRADARSERLKRDWLESVRHYERAASWWATVTAFKAAADARERVAAVSEGAKP